MELDILTLFPGMFTGPFQESIIKRAQEKDLVNIRVINIRDFSSDKHRSVDDYPFGGGSGMVTGRSMQVLSICRPSQTARVILTCPRERYLTNS